MLVRRVTLKDVDSSLSSGLVQFINCKVLRDHQLVNEHLWVENGIVVDPSPIFFRQKRLPAVQVDCNGCILAPGFIEIQINGGFGIDFSTDPVKLRENVEFVSTKLVRFGVTSFCPTLVTSPADFYKNSVNRIKKNTCVSNGATILGLHLEGPFISKDKKGAHTLKHIVDGFPNGYADADRMYGANMADSVSLITLAPELPNASTVVRELVARGVKVSLGHSTASLSIGEDAVQAGATCLTHLFNAMLPFHHRDPGLVGLLTSAQIPKDQIFYYGVIADGIHTDDAALRIAHRTHPDGLIIVTDAVAPFGLGDGQHQLGDAVIEVQRQKAIIVGTETLVGSISPMDFCVRHLVKAARCSVMEALECASLHPALFLGIDNRKGSLDFGKDADFIVLDNELHVLATFISGKSVWNA